MEVIESAVSVIDFEELLRPISEENRPASFSLAADLYEAVPEILRIIERGTFDRKNPLEKLKIIDYDRVIELATSGLTSEAKDLRFCVCLAVALTKKYGFLGLRDSLKLIRLIETDFWETLLPEIDEGDLEMRANTIELMVFELSKIVKTVSLTGERELDYLFWEHRSKIDIPTAVKELPLYLRKEVEPRLESWSYWYESGGVKNGTVEDFINELPDYVPRELTEKIKSSIIRSLEVSRIACQDWESATEATNRLFYESTHLALKECLTELRLLDRLNEEKFGRIQNPGVNDLLKVLDKIEILIGKNLERFYEVIE